MSDPYQETLAGELLIRNAPNLRHEIICQRLHGMMLRSVSNMPGTKLLGIRTHVQLAANTELCPDLGLVVLQTGRLWLAVEVVNSADHKPDTVFKKQIYEDIRLPRLWMVDPRYDNVEIYHATRYGLSLKQILAGKDVLVDGLLPEFQISMTDLFAESTSGSTFSL